MEFKTKPFAHQLTEWTEHARDTARAILWEQGTGKTKLAIDTACLLYSEGLIDRVLIVAPGGVHRNWVEQEILAHVPDWALPSLSALFYQGSRAGTQRHQREVQSLINHEGFAWLAISYDSFVTDLGKKAVKKFLHKRKVLYILDEAQAIKNPAAERTKTILRSAMYGTYRRILTGTPIAQGPFDLFSQMKFLDETFWEKVGLGSFTEFKAHFGVFAKMWNPTAFDPATKKRSGRTVDILKGYQRTDELAKLIQPISSRVTKDKVLDLPPKLYSKRYFAMNEEQKRIYNELHKEFITWVQLHRDELSQEATQGECPKCHGTREVIDEEGYVYECTSCVLQGPAAMGATPVMAPLAMVRMLRLQQVTCGYLPTEDETEPVHVIPGPNRRLQEALDLCEEAQHKVIVWARFQLDVTLLIEGLKARGIKAVRYDGQVDEDERAAAIALFTGSRAVYEGGKVVGREAVPEDEQAKVFIGNPAAGATGITLTQAKTTIYFSNSFKLIDRLQSEDRNHRIGQDNQVLYVDLIAEGTVDAKIVNSLRTKRGIATEILGDEVKEWI